MVFNRNVSAKLQEEIMAMWGLSNVQQYKKYLRLPLQLADKKLEHSQISNTKFEKTTVLEGTNDIPRWQGVIIKVVALSIPTYSMRCFLFLGRLYLELESMMTRFQWRQKEDERKIHWVSWDKMCESKFRGGLNFKDLRNFNMTLLAN